MLCRVIASEYPYPAGAVRVANLPVTILIKDVPAARRDQQLGDRDRTRTCPLPQPILPDPARTDSLHYGRHAMRFVVASALRWPGQVHAALGLGSHLTRPSPLHRERVRRDRGASASGWRAPGAHSGPAGWRDGRILATFGGRTASDGARHEHRHDDHRPPRLDPRHPRLPQAGHPVQGHHAAARATRRPSARRSTGSPSSSPAGRSTSVAAAEARGFIFGAPLALAAGRRLRADPQAGQAPLRDHRARVAARIRHRPPRGPHRRPRPGPPRPAARRRARHRRHHAGLLRPGPPDRRRGRRLRLRRRARLPQGPRATRAGEVFSLIAVLIGQSSGIQPRRSRIERPRCKPEERIDDRFSG